MYLPGKKPSNFDIWKGVRRRVHACDAHHSRDRSLTLEEDGEWLTQRTMHSVCMLIYDHMRSRPHGQPRVSVAVPADHRSRVHRNLAPLHIRRAHRDALHWRALQRQLD